MCSAGSNRRASLAIGDRVVAAFVDHETWTELSFQADPADRDEVRVRAESGRRTGGSRLHTVQPASGRSVLSLATEAVANAVADAGLRLADVDGMGSFMLSDDSVPCVAVSSALGLGPLRSVLDLQSGGQAPCHLVWQAAQSVARGDAEVVVVYRALNGRSGARVGSMQFAGMGGQYRYPIGYGAYLMYVGMWAQRFLYETGQGPEDLGAVAVTQRKYAEGNDRAVRRQPLALAEYLAEPYVVDPVPSLRLHRRGRWRLCRGGDITRAGA